MKSSFKLAALTAAILVAMITALSCLTASASSENRIMGDVNGNGYVDINDATFIQKVLCDLTDEPEDYIKYADVSGDAVVSVQDATIIQKYIANIITEFPANSIAPTTQPTTEPVTKPTVDPYATDPDGWSQQIIRP